MNHHSAASPDLIADIGGTNARFALVGADRQIYAEQLMTCADFPDPSAAIRCYLAEVAVPPPRQAAIAVATAIMGDWIQFTNSPWSFSIETTRQALGLERLLSLIHISEPTRPY